MSGRWQLVLLKFAVYSGRCRSNYWLVSLSVHQTALMLQESHQRQGNYRTWGALAKLNVYNNITKLGYAKMSFMHRQWMPVLLWHTWVGGSCSREMLIYWVLQSCSYHLVLCYVLENPGFRAWLNERKERVWRLKEFRSNNTQGFSYQRGRLESYVEVWRNKYLEGGGFEQEV
jgi:hypothetical protein